MTQSHPALGMEDVGPDLDALGLATDHCAVVGLQWGDEGKGKMVDLLARRFDLVVRYNGGANAGHSVVVGQQRYALHLIPSGVLYEKTLNVIANGVVVDPETLLEEIDGLAKRGVEVGPNLRISDRAHIVLPYHKVQDSLFDQAIAAAWKRPAIGTTGRGIGPCYADKALRSTAIRMGDLKNPKLLQEKLECAVALKNIILGALAAACGQPFEPFNSKQLLDQLLQFGRRMDSQICDTTYLLHEAMGANKRILFEGANATLLDIDHGTYPFVTSSNCSSLGVHTGAGIPGARVRNVLGIVKAYQTRVGGGPMPTELTDATGDQIREIGREYGTTTGRPRRCGWLDLMSVRYSAALSGTTALGLMLLDVLSNLETLPLCVGYRHNGKVLSNFPADAGVLSAVEPIYETLEGFAGPIDACTRFDDLPPQARAYVHRIEQFVGVPVKSVSVGPRRDQTIVR